MDESTVAIWGKRDGRGYRLQFSHDSELPGVPSVYSAGLEGAKEREVAAGPLRNLYVRRFTFYALLSPAARVVPASARIYHP